MIWWLTEVLNPATKTQANEDLCLLSLNGPNIHTSVEFMEACWSPQIVCIILPANLSCIFQPLDVNFFNHLKVAYHTLKDKHQMESGSVGVPKGLFYRWHQQAWEKAADPRQIWSAWAKAHLYPRKEVRLGLMKAIPPPTQPPNRSPSLRAYPHGSLSRYQALEWQYQPNSIC